MFMRVNSKCAHQVRPPLAAPGGGSRASISCPCVPTRCGRLPRAAQARGCGATPDSSRPSRTLSGLSVSDSKPPPRSRTQAESKKPPTAQRLISGGLHPAALHGSRWRMPTKDPPSPTSAGRCQQRRQSRAAVGIRGSQVRTKQSCRVRTQASKTPNPVC